MRNNINYIQTHEQKGRFIVEVLATGGMGFAPPRNHTIRVTDTKTKIRVTCGYTESQHKNKVICMHYLNAIINPNIYRLMYGCL